MLYLYRLKNEHLGSPQFIFFIALGKFGFPSSNLTGNCSFLLTALSILVHLLKSCNDFLILAVKPKPNMKGGANLIVLNWPTGKLESLNFYWEKQPKNVLCTINIGCIQFYWALD